MTIICYSKDGKAVSDFFLEDEMDVVWDSVVFCPKQILYYSTENIFTRIRLEIANSEMHWNDVIFRYNEIDIPINEFGAVLDWPNGFCDYNIQMSENIMRLAMNKRKGKKTTK